MPRGRSSSRTDPEHARRRRRLAFHRQRGHHRRDLLRPPRVLQPIPKAIPSAQLRRALRADVDEDAWATLYSTVSRPFPRPETGRIAVKVINHYGDEVLQVYDVGVVSGP